MTTGRTTVADLAVWVGSNPKIASKVADLMDQGRSRDEILGWLCDEYNEWKDTPKLPAWLLADYEYLTDFHKQWNEACVKERERTMTMRFTAEHMRNQSRRLESAVWLYEEREGRKRRCK